MYALTVAKGGPKMTVTADKPEGRRNFIFRRPGQAGVTNSTMKDFCDGMQGAVMDKPVVDHTGLTNGMTSAELDAGPVAVRRRWE